MIRNKRFLLIVLIPFLILFMVAEVTGFYIACLRSPRAMDKKPVKIKKISQLKAENNLLRMNIQAKRPEGIYIVVDTARNLLFLKNGNRIIREAIVSCGSGNILKAPDGKRKWVFDTPRGEFYVRSKYVDPTWIKPDWAFIEEGEYIPKNYKDRIETGVLGDYALGFGNGYFIHGTLYTRLLGRNVTHGCIRVGDEDLKAIYNASNIGTRIFIY
jgi:L,D-transpeptidase YbiS